MTTLIIFRCLLVTATLLLGGGCQDSTARDTEAVQSCFDRYRRAILDADGPIAAELVSTNTLKYYATMRQLALEGPPDLIKRLSSADKFLALSIRHRVPLANVESMNPKTLFMHAVNEQWIGRGLVENNLLGPITVAETSATSTATPLPIPWVFHREDDGWKIDLISAMPYANAAFQKMIAEQGATEDQLIFSILEEVSGTPVTESIWQPMIEPAASQPELDTPHPETDGS